MTPARNIVLFFVVLQGERHEYKALNILNIEWRVSRRSVWIRELRNQIHIGVIDINRALSEVGGQENSPARVRGQRNTFVNGVSALRENLRIEAECAAPARDRP